MALTNKNSIKNKINKLMATPKKNTKANKKEMPVKAPAVVAEETVVPTPETKEVEEPIVEMIQEMQEQIIEQIAEVKEQEAEFMEKLETEPENAQELLENEIDRVTEAMQNLQEKINELEQRVENKREVITTTTWNGWSYDN